MILMALLVGSEGLTGYLQGASVNDPLDLEFFLDSLVCEDSHRCGVLTVLADMQCTEQ